MKKWKSIPQPGIHKLPIIEDPMSALYNSQKKSRKLERGYRRKLYELLGEAFRIAYTFDRDFEAWEKLIKDPFWKGRTKKPRRDKDSHKRLLYVLLFTLDAKGKHSYDRAYKYYRGLEFAIEDGADPQKIAEYIESEGGIEKLYGRAKEARPAKKHVDEAYYDNVIDDENKRQEKQDLEQDEAAVDLDSIHDFGPEDPPGNARGAGGSYVALIEAARVGSGEAFVTGIDNKRLRKLLTLEKGAKASIVVRRTGKKDGWPRFKTTKVKRLKR